MDLEILANDFEESINVQLAQLLEHPTGTGKVQGILEATETFLRSWSSSSKGEIQDSSFPSDTLRWIFSNVIKELGSGNPEWGDSFWTMLEEVGTFHVGRDLIIEFLPTCLSLDSTSEATSELLANIKLLVDSEDGVFGAVLTSMLSMVQAGSLNHTHLHAFVMDCLDLSDEKYALERLPYVWKVLTVNAVNSNMEAQTVIETIRAVCLQLQTNQAMHTNHLQTSKSVLGLVTILKSGLSEVVADGVLNSMEALCSAASPPSCFSVEMVGNDSCNDMSSELQEPMLSWFDSVVLLWYHGHAIHGERAEAILFDAIAMKLMPQSAFNVLVAAARHAPALAESDDLPLILWEMLGKSCHCLLWAPLHRPYHAHVVETTKLTLQFVCECIVRDAPDAQSRQLATSLVLFCDNAAEIFQQNSGSLANSASLQSSLATCFGLLEKMPVRLLRPCTKVLTNLTKEINLEFDCEAFGALCLVNYHSCTPMTNRRKLLTPINECFLVVRSLLATGSSNKSIDDSSCSRGLHIAAHILPVLSRAEVSMLWEMVLQIVFPMSGEPVHPSVGYPAIALMKAFGESNSVAGSDQQGYRKNVVDKLALIMAKERFVRYIKGRASPDQPTKGRIFFLPAQPSLLVHRSHSEERKMIHSLSHATTQLLGCEWYEWSGRANFLHRLMDTYLYFCRDQEKMGATIWSPRPWVESLLEFPIVDVSQIRPTGVSQQRCRDMLASVFTGKSLCSDYVSLGNLVWRDMPSLFASVRSNDDKIRLLQEMTKFARMIEVQLVICVAILKHVFEHAEVHSRQQSLQLTTTANEDTQSDEDALDDDCVQLVQRQISRIYDLRTRCLALQRTLKSISRKRRIHKKAKRKRGSSASTVLPEKVRSVAELGAAHLGNLCTIFCRSSFMPPSAIWYCIMNPREDALLLSTYDDIRERLANDVLVLPDNASVLVSFRLRLVQHLTSQYETALHNEDNEMSPEQASPCSILPRFCSSLRLSVNLLRRVGSWGQHPCWSTKLDGVASLMTALVSSYFRLLSNVIHYHSCSSEGDTTSNVSITDFAQAYVTMLGTPTHPSEEATQQSHRGYKANTTTTSAICTVFRPLLDTCPTENIATELMNTLSTLAIHADGSEAIKPILALNWETMKATRLILSKRADSPPPLVYRLALKSRAGDGSSTNSVEQSLNNSLLAQCHSTQASRHIRTSFVNGLLRQWGMIAISGSSSALFAEHLGRTVSLLRDFVADTESTFFGAQSRKEPKDDTLPHQYEDSDDDYIPKQNTRGGPIATPFEIQNLNVNSFPVYFQLVFQQTIAAIASTKVRTGKNLHKGPYQYLEKLIGVSGACFDQYIEAIDCFPESSVNNTVTATCRLLKVIGIKVDKCIQWRSEQPAPAASDTASGQPDMASIHFLRGLIHQISRCIVSKVKHLQNLLLTEKLAPSAKLVRLGALQLKLERKISRVVSENGLVHFVEQQNSGKRSREVAGISDRESDSLGLESGEGNSMDEDENSEEDSLLDESDSFGAKGGWGDDSEDDETYSGTDAWKIDGGLSLTH